MHMLVDYGLFLAKMITLVVALLLLTAGLIALLSKGKALRKDHLDVKKINEKYEEMEKTLKEAILPKKGFKRFEKTLAKKQKKEEQESRRKIYVLHFAGDIRASAVDCLREEITAVLSVASLTDEIVVRVESAGGMVHAYGLAASQLQRIKDKRIPLTVAIDKVAASGGYLMACVADKILAAPFSIIGSIGVIAQLPNFNRWLKKHEVDFEQVTAGKYKRTLTLFGENTEDAREKMQEDLEEVHHYFKSFVAQHRPDVAIDEVSTGEHWLGTKALQLKLVDELQTSDDYLFSAYRTADIFEVFYSKKKSWLEKFLNTAEGKLGISKAQLPISF
jgi:serine protease SohB